MIGTACTSPGDPTPTPIAAPSSLRAAVATVGVTPTAAPTASPSPSPAIAGTYLALGDSLAVGAGASERGLGYVGRLFEALRGAEGVLGASVLRNLAVSGETSTLMIRTGRLAGALEAIAAGDPPLSLVTLDIGGNDLLRLLGTEALPSASGCRCSHSSAETIRPLLRHEPREWARRRSTR